MSKHRKRNQTPKKANTFSPTSNPDYHAAMVELRRSNATVPVRNMTKYNRNDERRAMQRGDY